MKKKKILMFLQPEVGGAERVTVTIGKKLSEEKFDVSFCSVGNGNNTIAHFIPERYSRDWIKTDDALKILWGICKKIKRDDPDIVFSSVININTKLLLLKPLFPKKTFIIRSDNNFEYFDKKHQWMIRLTYKRAEKVIAQTEEMKEGLVLGAKINSNKVVVARNPIDTKYIDENTERSESPYQDAKGRKIVASGRFAYAKGFDVLIEAFSMLKKRIVDAELFIVGRTGGDDNPVYRNVKELIGRHQLNDCVHCVGYQSNPYPYIKYADCFVLSSRAEGLPNVVLESLYLKTPVAATKCIPAISRLIEDGVNGYHAEVENPKSIAVAMENCLNMQFVDENKDYDDFAVFEKIFECLENLE